MKGKREGRRKIERKDWEERKKAEIRGEVKKEKKEITRGKNKIKPCQKKKRKENNKKRKEVTWLCEIFGNNLVREGLLIVYHVTEERLIANTGLDYLI